MPEPTDVETVRGSPDTWLDAATEKLVNSGVESVRIMPLARQLNLSRTSFYWFFRDREELLATLLARWRDKNTRNWVARTQAYAQNIAEAVLNVFDCWFDDAIFDNRYEAAIRSWGQQAPEIAAEMAAADAARINALTAMFGRFGYAPLAADVRAHTMYLTQLGYISMKTTETIAARMARIAQYVEVFTGQPPTTHELQRFFARHPFAGPVGQSARRRKNQVPGMSARRAQGTKNATKDARDTKNAKSAKGATRTMKNDDSTSRPPSPPATQRTQKRQTRASPGKAPTRRAR